MVENEIKIYGNTNFVSINLYISWIINEHFTTYLKCFRIFFHRFFFRNFFKTSFPC